MADAKPASAISQLNILFRKLSERLSEDDVDEVKNLLRGEQVSKHDMDKLRSAFDVFHHLKERGDIASDNLDLLVQLFQEMGREPLKELVRTFQSEHSTPLGKESSRDEKSRQETKSESLPGRAQSRLKRFLNGSGVHAVYDSQGGDITLPAVNQNDQDKAAGANVKQKRVLIVPNESRSLLHGAGWKRHVNEVEEKFAVVVECFTYQPDRVTVIGFVDNVESAVAGIQRYIDSNTAVDRFVCVASAKVEFLFKHMKAAIDDLGESGVAVEKKINKDNGTNGVIIHGSKLNIGSGEERIKEYMNAICNERRSMEKPGLAKFFHGERGQALVKFVEEEHSCVIDFSIAKSRDDNTCSEAEIEPFQRSQTRITTVCQVQLNAGPRLVVMKGDITQLRVDAIVNPANDKLEHSDGLAKAIVDAGGKIIQQECIKIVRKHGKLLDGQAVSTAPGRLHCKRVIHAVGPRWDVGKDKDIERQCMEKKLLLADAVSQSLKEAEKWACKSIAVPAISSGIFGFPVDVCTDVIVEAVQMYNFQNRTELLDVFLVDVSDGVCSMFKKAFERYCGHSNVFTQENFTTSKGRYMAPWLRRKNTQAPERKVQPLPVVWFDISAGSQTDVKSAFDNLRKYIEMGVCEKVVEDRDVGSLTDEEITKISELALSLQAHIEKIDTGRVCRLKLTGTPEAVMTLNDKVTESLKRLQEEHRRDAAATALAKNVAWLYWNEDGFEEYEDEVAGYIEKEYQARSPDVRFELDGSSYLVCFDSMTEIDLTGESKVSVRRDFKEGGISLPKHWAPMHDSERVKQVPLIKSSEEYTRIADGFKKSMLPTVTNIVEIQRIQNKQLYRQVMLKRQAMENKSKPGIQIERNLYHGTSFDTCAKINALGFNISFAGKHAGAYGRGCYFALNANYSSSPRDANGHKHMYFCKVLTGENTRGRSEMLVPPAKNPNNPTDYFDSVVDNTANPTIFVIFNDAMAYPEYLITFK